MASIKKNFAYQAMWQILSMILPLVTSPLLSRVLGAEGIGVYSFASSVVGYFVLLANFGVYRHGIQKISTARDDPEKCNHVFWEIWWLHSIISVIVGGFYILFVINTTDHRMFYLIMGLQYLGGILNIDWLFAGMEDFKKITIRDTIIKLVTFVLILLFIHDRSNLVVYISIMSLGSLAGGVVFWLSVPQFVHLVPVTGKRVFSHSKGMAIFFIPVVIENVYISMDKIMLGIMDNKEAVGFYENSEKALIAQRIIHALIAVIMPRMTFLIHNRAEEEIQKLMKKIIDFAMVLSMAFGIGTAAVSQEFSVVFWGREFEPCAILIFIMALAIPAEGLSRIIRDEFLLPSGQNKRYMLCASLGAATNFLINCIFIPYYGVIVAAISTFISEFVVLLAQCVIVRKQLPIIRYIKEGCVYIPLGAIMFPVIRGIANGLGMHVYTLLFEIIAGAVIYIGLCSIYWKITNQTYYFGVMKKMYYKIFRMKQKD